MGGKLSIEIDTSGHVIDLQSYRSGQFGDAKEKEIDRERKHYARIEALIAKQVAKPGLIHDIFHYIQDTAASDDPIISFAATYSLLSAFFGRRYETQYHPGRNGVYTNSNVAVLAVTGRGKDHLRIKLSEILDLVNTSLIGGDTATSAGGIIHALEKYPSRLFMWDEFGIELKTIFDARAAEHKKAIAATIMKLFSASNSVFRGADRAKVRLKKNSDENLKELNARNDLQSPSMCLFATSTQDQFFDALRKSSAASGFINRVLIFNTPAEWLPINRAEKDLSKIRADFHRIITQLQGCEAAWAKIYAENSAKIDLDRMAFEKPLVLTTNLMPDARRHLQHIEDVIQPARRDSSDMPSMWIRATEYCIKMASLFALSRDWRERCITWEDVVAAWDIVEFLVADSVRLFADQVSDNIIEGNHKRVLSIIKEVAEISHSDLLMKTRFLKRQERQEIIDNLKESGSIVEGKKKIGNSQKLSAIYQFNRG